MPGGGSARGFLELERLVLAHDPPEGVRLSVGSGHKSRKGFVNSDLAVLPGLDLAADAYDLPFRDNAISVVIVEDLLEHLDVMSAMRELHRVLMPGGILGIQAVHFSSRDFPYDPTHIRAFSVRTFDFFSTIGKGAERRYYFDFRFEAILFRGLQFHRGALLHNRLVERAVNANYRLLDLYELTGLRGLFPASNVVAILRK